MIESLLLNLRSRDDVSAEEERLLRSIIVREKRFDIGEDLVSQGSRPQYSTLIIGGFAARYKHTEDGSRQITALNIAGDFVDLHAFPLKTIDHGIVAMSACHAAFAYHSDLAEVTEREPHLTRLLWLSTIIDAAIHREWIVAMGRRTPTGHLAHLICELFVRLQVVRKVDGMSFHFPLTQSEVADVLGLSVVHLNKTLQQLRASKLISWENRTILILDWRGLQDLAEFDPTYLSLVREPR
jgi:CRP-like cAMP-binding protein